VAGLGAEVGVIVLYESGNITAHVDPQVASGQDLIHLVSTWMSNRGRGVVLFNLLGFQGV
jgi:hypothetical protein